MLWVYRARGSHPRGCEGAVHEPRPDHSKYLDTSIRIEMIHFFVLIFILPPKSRSSSLLTRHNSSVDAPALGGCHIVLVGLSDDHQYQRKPMPSGFEEIICLESRFRSRFRSRLGIFAIKQAHITGNRISIWVSVVIIDRQHEPKSHIIKCLSNLIRDVPYIHPVNVRPGTSFPTWRSVERSKQYLHLTLHAIRSTDM